MTGANEIETKVWAVVMTAVLLSMIFSPSHNVPCSETIKVKKISNFYLNFTCTCVENHSGWILGKDSLGSEVKVPFVGFLDFEEIAKPGDTFVKLKDSSYYTLYKPGGGIYIFDIKDDCRNFAELRTNKKIQ